MQMDSTEMEKDHLQYHQFIHNDVALGNKKESVPLQQAIPSGIITDKPLILLIKLKLMFDMAVISQPF